MRRCGSRTRLGVAGAPRILAILFGVFLPLFIIVAFALRRLRAKESSLLLDVDRGYRIRSSDTGGELRAGSFESVIGPDRGYGGDARALYLATQDGMFKLVERCSTAEQDWLIDEVSDFLGDHG